MALAAPTVPTDVQQPGTQPSQVPAYPSPVSGPGNCKACHGSTGNPDYEPSFGWQGSMMSHASRDPLFWAALAIVEQDFLPDPSPTQRGGAGDFCLRCHLPRGWLQGRSTPTDGSAMQNTTTGDVHGVECQHCHLLVNPDPPTNVPGTVEQQSAPFLAHDGSSGYYGSGMYVINNDASAPSRLGPYSVPGDANPPHAAKQSGFDRQGELCGTCHDVSNPAVGDLAHNFGAQQPLAPGSYSGVQGAPVTQKAAFKNPPYAYGIVERTYSEWKASAFPTLLVNDFNTLPAELRTAGGAIERARSRAWNGTTANYADGTARYFTCQTCHLSASTGKGATGSTTPVRTDLPRHDLTGGGYWVPDAIVYQNANLTLRFGGGLAADQITAMAAGQLRAQDTLRSAARLEAAQQGAGLAVRVTNLTGHKLISGYPEGRRMWLNVKWRDALGGLIREDGAYGPIGRSVQSVPVQSLLDPDDTVVFEVEPGIDREWAGQLVALGHDPALPLSYDRMTDQVTETLASLAAQPPGSAAHTFHFVLNNVLLHDDRIPPYGFARAAATTRNALPVPATQYGNPGPSGTYQHWSDSQLAIPTGAATAEVRLYYQQTSWEYIQFLWLQNDQQSVFLGQEGVNLLSAWLHTGESPPFEMAHVDIGLSATPGPPGEASLHASYDDGSHQIQVAYTPACEAIEHTIYYGPLAAVSTYGYSGAVCNVGSSGSAAFDPGAGSFFFLVVGANGAVEGSYGRASSGAERPEHTGTLGCDRPQDLSATCTP